MHIHQGAYRYLKKKKKKRENYLTKKKERKDRRIERPSSSSNSAITCPDSHTFSRFLERILERISSLEEGEEKSLERNTSSK